MVPHREYVTLLYGMKSGKIHCNTWKVPILDSRGPHHLPIWAASACRTMSHPLWSQHNSVQLFKSYASAKMIKPILATLYDLSGWCFFKIAQLSLLLSSLSHLKSYVLHRRFSNGSILLNIHELLTLILLLISKKLLSEIPPSRKTLVSPVEPAWRASPVEPVWRLRFSGCFKFVYPVRSMGNVFTVQIWIIYINIAAYKMCQ